MAICCLLCAYACTCSPCHLYFEWHICSHDHPTSLATSQKAYEAADRAASAAKLAGKPQYLVSPSSLPCVGSKKVYRVRTQPWGYRTSVYTEQVNSSCAS